MVKARLPEPQSPVVEMHTQRKRRLITAATACRGMNRGSRHPRAAGRRPVRPVQGMDGAPTSVSGVCWRRTAGSPTGREPERRRSRRSSRRTGEPSTGRRAAGACDGRDGREAECRKPQRSERQPLRHAGAGELGAGTTRTPSSGRGGWKRAGASQHLAGRLLHFGQIRAFWRLNCQSIATVGLNRQLSTV